MSNEPKAGKGIDPEMLAAYIDNRLPPEHRAAVEAQLASDPESRELLLDTLEALDDNEIKALEVKEPSKQPITFAPKPQTSRVRTLMIAGGVLAAAAAIVLVVMQPAFLRRYVGGVEDPLMAELVAAVGRDRVVEARLTGGFRYGSLLPVTRTVPDLSKQNLALLAVAGEAQKRQQLSPSPEHARVWAASLIQLRDFDGAIKILENIEVQSPVSLSDLSVAYFARAASLDRAEDLPVALNYVGRALELDASLLEALFNRALILQRLGLVEQARDAWRAYIAADSGSEWSSEARERLDETLNAPKAKSVDDVTQLAHEDISEACQAAGVDGQLAREVIEDGLLPEWAAHQLKRAPEAASTLQLAATLANCLTRSSPRSTTQAAVLVVERASAQEQDELAHAYLSWHEGRQHYANSAPDKFEGPFASAGRVFARYNSPHQNWTRQYAIGALFYRGLLDQALAATIALERAAIAAGDDVLLARLKWNQGSVAFQRAEFGVAIQFYRQALAFFEANHEIENQAAMHQSIAESLGRIGQDADAWGAHLKALQALPKLRDYRRIHSAASSPGFTASLAELHYTAREFFAEGRALAIANGNASYQFDAEANLGRALVSMRHVDEARLVLDHALTLRGRVTNANMRSRHSGEVFLGLATIEELAGFPEKSLHYADQAIAEVQSVSSEYRAGAMYLVKANALAALGRTEEALNVVGLGADAIESKKARLQQGTQRISYADRSWDLYGAGMSIASFAHSDPLQALRWLERGRRRTFDAGAELPVDLDTSRLSTSSGILVVSSHNNQLFLWLLTSGGLRFFQKTPLPDLRRLGDIRPDRSTLEAGFRVIIEPLRAELEGLQSLTIVPDWNTQYLPFAALIDPQTKQPLISALSIDYAPSVSAGLRSQSRTSRQRPFRRAAVVGGAGRTLLPLPKASAELRSVASLYPEAIRIEGDDVSVARLRSVFGKVDVLHLAMHAVVDRRFRDRVLLDIPDDNEFGISADSVLPLSDTPPRLVVLAACQSARGPMMRGELLTSVARPFAEAGAERVVAATHDIPDDLTLQFMRRFHTLVVERADVSVAFSETQRTMAEQFPSDPWWATFVLMRLK